ncbi:biotin transporter BioY [Thermatribacter velox]|uniref:Biotin transporter n=1 Tax=Thermatribacter velox TaxID=3039681 RepID=A0ABZ2YCK0_9BACT
MHFQSLRLARCALVVALCVVSSLFSRYAQGVVPFSVLPFVVVLSGWLLRPQEAFWSLSAYVLLGLLGLPVFASPPFGGPTYLFKPTFGFLLGFVLGAFLISALKDKKLFRKSILGVIFLSELGMLIIYLPGLFYLWLAFSLFMGKPIGFNRVLQVGFYPFLGFDVVKAFLAGMLFWKTKGRIAA